MDAAQMQTQIIEMDAKMNELFATGDAYLAELEGLRAKGKAASAAASSSAPFEKRRKKKGSTLKERDPW